MPGLLTLFAIAAGANRSQYLLLACLSRPHREVDADDQNEPQHGLTDSLRRVSTDIGKITW